MEPRLGDQTFEELWARHAESMLAFFARRTLDPEAAMDLVGETFAEAFAGRRRYRGSTREEAAGFLFAIARHQLSQWYRRGSVRRRAMRRLGVERVALDDESFARVEELARSEPTRAAVAEALSLLGPHQREALELRVVQERGYAEVARRLGVSEATARARVSRALRALDRALTSVEGRA